VRRKTHEACYVSDEGIAVVPASSWIYPRVFVSNLRKVNTGHPEAAAQLIGDNVKEMTSPTRDGRAMIAAGMIRPGATAETRPVGPTVTIGGLCRTAPC
jgi:hypothetical protein